MLTLWVLAAMIVLAAGLGAMVRTEAQISRIFADIIRCRWAARAGENRGLTQVQKLASQPNTYFEERALRFTSEDDGVELADAAYEVTIDDEAARVNINVASRRVLQELFGSREIADCIIDWRDEDDQPQPLGAETQYYAGERTPYRCKNAPFDTVRELLLVKGVTREMLETPVTEDDLALEELLTVCSRDPNVTVEGKQRLNIQTADRGKLKAELGDVLTDQDFDAIIRYRDGSAGGSKTPQPPGARQRQRPDRRVRTVRGRRFQTAADITRVPGLSREKVAKIYDRLTCSEAKVRVGRINVNTAPVEVLASLPGIGRSTAEEIVDYRSRTGGFPDVGALLNVKALSDRDFRRCADLLTARSRVFRIVSTGRLARTAGTIVCVADATDGKSPQIRYWRE